MHTELRSYNTIIAAGAGGCSFELHDVQHANARRLHGITAGAAVIYTRYLPVYIMEQYRCTSSTDVLLCLARTLPRKFTFAGERLDQEGKRCTSFLLESASLSSGRNGAQMTADGHVHVSAAVKKMGSDPIPGDDFCKALIFWDVFLGNISFYLVLEFISSFSSRSHPPVRKCTDYFGMNMTTNMASKPEHGGATSSTNTCGNVMNV